MRWPTLTGTQPQWEVAGVDYAVGIPTGTTLSAPTTLSGTGISVNSSNHQVTITGNNITINAIDFSLNGGWSLILSGVTGTTVQNCNFAVGTNAQPMFNGDFAGTNNTTITNCVFNMNGLSDNFNNGAVQIQGNVTATYNLIENSAADHWDQNGSGSTVQNLTLKFNVFVNSGQGASGLHPDQLQFEGGTYTCNVEFNTYYQSLTGATGGTQGICPDEQNHNGTTMAGASVIANNTIIALSSGAINSQFQSTTTTAGATITMNQNYIDPSGDGAVFKYSGAAAAQNIQTNNINMVTGAALNS